MDCACAADRRTPPSRQDHITVLIIAVALAYIQCGNLRGSRNFGRMLFTVCKEECVELVIAKIIS